MSDSTTFKSITTESSHPNLENINDEKSLIQQISEPDEKPQKFIIKSHEKIVNLKEILQVAFWLRMICFYTLITNYLIILWNSMNKLFPGIQ